jgi:ABC-2 type transport system permease protein
LEATAAGEATTVTLYLGAAAPPEVASTLEGFVAEVAYGVAGSPPPVDPRTEVRVLGEDRVGNQVTLREQLRPMLAFFVLLVETLALATLVAAEVQQRTVTAILVTPATAADFLAAKGLLGTGVAFIETALIMALIGGLATGAPILLVALLLGAALVTGFGMIAGAYGRDFMTVLFLSMAFMIPLMIPGFAALFPGTASTWVRALPSWPLVDTIVAVTTQGSGWSDVAGNLLLLLGWCVVAFGAGVVVLGRKVARL